MTTTPAASFSLGPLGEAVNRRITRWDEERFARRLWAKDHTLWNDEEVPELSDRLGWLWLPDHMKESVAGIQEFADEIREIADHVVLLGMGGSSLAPEVYQSTFGNADGYPELLVLDSTHPGAVQAVHDRINPLRTVFLVASKSGGTLETMSFFHYFWAVISELAAPDAGAHFVALTDAGSRLEVLAAERNFRRVFVTDPDVGGRYSALTHFGIVPAALVGVDIAALIARSAAMADACGPEIPAAENPGLVLGAAMGEAALAGRDKVTYVVSPSLAAFPGWAEQLVAESTGKDDTGIVPVAGEPLGSHEVYADDRLFIHVMVAGEDPMGQPAALEVLQAAGHPIVRIVLDDVLDLGGEFYRHEVAVAAAGAILEIQPFNQPDVQVAKDLARQAMTPEGLDGALVEVLTDDSELLAAAWSGWTGSIARGDYLSIQAYLPMDAGTTALLDRFQHELRDRFGVAVTVGYGPRFLHSTGQLHKGGANNGVFLQIVDTPSLDLAVPEASFTFDRLVIGQSAGDYQALTNRGRRVLRVNLEDEAASGLAAIVGLASV